MTPLLADFLRDRELAQEFDCPPETLATWRHRGIGPPYTKIGRSVWYRRADVEAWLAAQQRGKRVA